MNGPEVLSKFVGESEKNVRDLFADAENDQRTLGVKELFTLCFVLLLFSFSYHQCDNLALLLNFSGDDSELHVIIFDEIDAICKVICFIQAVVNLDNSNLRQLTFCRM